MKRQGYVNELYESFKLTDCYRPRTFAHNFYTYSIMAASGVGYLIAKRGGYHTLTLGLAFVAAPIFSLMQKKELDYY